jgi:hypothetical protein
MKYRFHSPHRRIATSQIGHLTCIDASDKVRSLPSPECRPAFGTGASSPAPNPPRTQTNRVLELSSVPRGRGRLENRNRSHHQVESVRKVSDLCHNLVWTCVGHPASEACQASPSCRGKCASVANAGQNRVSKTGSSSPSDRLPIGQNRPTFTGFDRRTSEHQRSNRLPDRLSNFPVRLGKRR